MDSPLEAELEAMISVAEQISADLEEQQQQHVTMEVRSRVEISSTARDPLPFTRLWLPRL